MRCILPISIDKTAPRQQRAEMETPCSGRWEAPRCCLERAVDLDGYLPRRERWGTQRGGCPPVSRPHAPSARRD